MTMELSVIKPDFKSLVEQLTIALSKKSAWKDRVTSSTGQTLIEMLSAIGAYSQYTIESSYQEVWPESAKNKGSLYAAASFLGVRFNRKLPASVAVRLHATTTRIIPAYTQFTGAGTYWFNRDPLRVTTESKEFTLYQGKVMNTSVQGLGTSFQAFVTQESDFAVSDIDMFVSINDEAIPASQSGLWSYRDRHGCQHFTLPDGRAIVMFGNETYGSIPQINDNVEIFYVVTLGADGNNIATLGKAFGQELEPTVTGTGASQSSGGADQTDPFVYKNLSPSLFGAFDAAVTPDQYKAMPIQYPGVLDAVVTSQREMNPNALTLMNTIRVSLLTNATLNTGQWNDFVSWYQDHSQFTPKIIRYEPQAFGVDLYLEVYCKNLANLVDVKANVEKSIEALFEPRRGILGLDVYRSDIDAAIRAADSNVEFAIIRAPTTDVLLNAYNVDYPTLTPVLGSLPPGTYEYAITVVSSLGGETAPANWSSIVTTSTGGVRVKWEPVLNALQYKVWGRIVGKSGNYGLLATVSNLTYEFLDTGGVNPTGKVPLVSTVNVYYPRIAYLQIHTMYTDRESMEYGGSNGFAS